MKPKLLYAICVTACGALLPGAAQATITDSLTGPSDIELHQSALTATTTIDWIGDRFAGKIALDDCKQLKY